MKLHLHYCKHLLLLVVILHATQYNAKAQFPAPYCRVNFATGVMPMTLVKFAGVNQANSAVVTGASEMLDFLQDTAMVIAGQDYPVTVKGVTSPTGSSSSNFVLFADWNHNNSFSDSGEAYDMGYLYYSTGIDTVEKTVKINIPTKALLGYTRFRILKISAALYPAKACDTMKARKGQSADFTILVTSPDCYPPTNILVNAASNSATVTWSPTATLPLGYEWIIDQSSLTPITTGTFVTATNLSVTKTNLIPQTNYFIHVRTNCTNGTYSQWVTKSFTTPPSCIDPTIVRGKVTNYSAVITWHPILNAISYEYIYDTSKIFPITVLPTVTTDTFFVATSLPSNTDFYAYVRAKCDATDYSGWSRHLFFTLSANCDSPINLTATGLSSSSVQVSWDTLPNAQHYEYVIDQTPGSPIIAPIITNTNTNTVTGLSSGTTYYLHVRYFCGGHDFSPWATLPFSICPVPLHLTTNNITGVSAKANWDPVGNALKYEYLVDLDPLDPVGQVVGSKDTVSTNVDLRNLYKSTTYYFHVRALCSSQNWSSWTTSSPFTTLNQDDTDTTNPSDIALLSLNSECVKIFPNPAGNNISIQILDEKAKTNKLAILDILGNEIKQIDIVGKVVDVYIGDLKPGVYLMRYKSNKITRIERFIKQ